MRTIDHKHPFHRLYQRPRLSILDLGSWILDLGSWILDLGSWILDLGLTDLSKTQPSYSEQASSESEVSQLLAGSYV